MIEKSPGVGERQSVDRGEHRADALLRREWRFLAAHVSADPPGVHGDAGDAVGSQLVAHGDGEHVEGGLAGAIGVRGASAVGAGVVGDASELAADVDDDPARPAAQGRERLASNENGRDAVDHKDARELGRGERRERASFRADPDVVDENIDGVVAPLLGEEVNARRVTRVENGRALRTERWTPPISNGAQDKVPAGGQLANKLTAQTAPGTSNCPSSDHGEVSHAPRNGRPAIEEKGRSKVIDRVPELWNVR